MNLTTLLQFVEPSPDNDGLCVLNSWLQTTPLSRLEPVELDAHLEFALVARQMAWADYDTARIHVQYDAPHVITILHQVSIPGTIRVTGKSIISQRGICYVKANAKMAVMDRVERSASPCFVASLEESRLFVRREEFDCNSFSLLIYGRATQVVGALIHLAIEGGRLTLEISRGRELLAQLEEHYRLVFGCKIQRAQRFLDLACEYTIWEAAKKVLAGVRCRRALVRREAVRLDLMRKLTLPRLAWAAKQLHRPLRFGDEVRRLAVVCRYPGPKASFHACYHDLHEWVDYNYLSAPLSACSETVLARLRELNSVEVDNLGMITLPPVQIPSASFPPRLPLVARAGGCLLAAARRCHNMFTFLVCRLVRQILGGMTCKDAVVALCCRQKDILRAFPSEPHPFEPFTVGAAVRMLSGPDVFLSHRDVASARNLFLWVQIKRQKGKSPSLMEWKARQTKGFEILPAKYSACYSGFGGDLDLVMSRPLYPSDACLRQGAPNFSKSPRACNGKKAQIVCCPCVYKVSFVETCRV